ncbi:MAG: hypothetical protein ABL903_07690, partial [Methylococcales bacterium]
IYHVGDALYLTCFSFKIIEIERLSHNLVTTVSSRTMPPASVGSATEFNLLNAAADIPVKDIGITFEHLSFWPKPEGLCLT